MKQGKRVLAWVLSFAMLLTGVVPEAVRKAEAKVTTSLKTTEKPDEENQAFLMFADQTWAWQNWNTRVTGGVGRDALITGNGTYTVSINKEDFIDADEKSAADGTAIFCVDIMGICNTQKYDASNLAFSNVVVKADGRTIQTDLAKMYEGNIEGKGNYRLEIRSEYGYSGGEFDTMDEFDEMNPDFTFENSLSVTFTIKGIKKGKTPEGAFKTADGTSVVAVGGDREKAADAAGGEDPDTTPESGVTSKPGESPTRKPSAAPSTTPTRKPDVAPSTTPTRKPTASPEPTEKPDEENQAFLMFTDQKWTWQNWNTRVTGGVGRDALITGNGTYTVSINKEDFIDADEKSEVEAPADGTTVFCVDIMGICNTQKFDASNLAFSNVVVKADGRTIQTDLTKMYEGNIEGKGNYKLEIRNYYGYGHGEFLTKDEFDALNPDFTFENSLSVTFTIKGIKKGKTPAGAFETADGTSVVAVGGDREKAADAASGEDPDATQKPGVSPTRKPSAAPSTTPTRKPDVAPGVTSTRKPTATRKPGATVKPGGTQKPGATRKPGATVKPGGTQKPGATKNPTVTRKPGATEKPTDTMKPGATWKPGRTAEPEQTTKPEGTMDPQTSSIPENSLAPGSSGKPSITASPAASFVPGQETGSGTGQTDRVNGTQTSVRGGTLDDGEDTTGADNPVQKLKAVKMFTIKKGKTKKVTVKIVAEDNTRKTTDRAIVSTSNRKRVKISAKKLLKGKYTFKVAAKQKGNVVITVIIGTKMRRIKVKCK